MVRTDGSRLSPAFASSFSASSSPHALASPDGASSPRRRHVGVQTSVPSREYIGPQARASQAPEFFKQGWLHRPKTVATLCTSLAVIFVAAQVVSSGSEPENLKYRIVWGSTAAVSMFLVFGTLQFPDGLLVRPSPIFWRFIKGCSVLYLVLLVFLLFQDLDDVRRGLRYIDPSLGKPLPEKSYAQNCHSFSTLAGSMDVFVLAHFFGWLVKGLIIRDARLLWILSLLFEWMEISLRHILPNFWECWWDHLILDVFGCNLLGMYLGLALCRSLQMKEYLWHDDSPPDTPRSDLLSPAPSPSAAAAKGCAATDPNVPSGAPLSPAASPVSPSGNERRGSTRSASPNRRRRSICRAVPGSLRQLAPYEWTGYKWPRLFSSASTFVSLLLYCVAVTLLDLNVFFLKAELWLHPSHWLILARITLWTFMAAAGTREYYEFVTDVNCKRMGVQCWIDLAVVSTEALLSVKWFHGLQPHDPCPQWIIVAWIAIACVLAAAIVWLICRPRPPSLKRMSSLSHSGGFSHPASLSEDLYLQETFLEGPKDK
ncbi:Phosphatidylserine synthase 2,related [Neospora caninum Liverpool]|uniref:Phosphatidylserine synthase 2, related n=1 Tax=Neospora caninum (strain Liverpool) TaxID=572307 RepID=F0VGG8_NEOCL|nr:Phosphatidylserine synthase 2,related [Neospora caninum Liverpool]CBZ52812.1 Phosphatidylserine synthase 2,related [Neospora caninum Liverpool]CEL66793.1 TPA: Phosphatidylserine synthase 2, related [Neospora caninum Liverpool]|eukprot:XP_003882844.1 Phosphatidylserine synthase 2,related [Neospora caninum Liverpool]